MFSPAELLKESDQPKGYLTRNLFFHLYNLPRITFLEPPHCTTPARVIHVIHVKGAAWIGAVLTLSSCEQQARLI